MTIEASKREGGFVLACDGKRIPFRVEYRRRRSLAITVHPDLRLEVVAPQGSGIKQVLHRVEKRSGWILRQRRYFEQFMPSSPPPRFVPGETHRYLGRQYRLKVHRSTGEAVKLLGRFLHVWTNPGFDFNCVQAMVERWFREHAEVTFARRLRHCLERYPVLRKKAVRRLAVRKMSKRWGSCTKSGDILLNVDLIKAPIDCIDYVIVHELCHLHVRNHGRIFVGLLSRCLPDWERRKARLEGSGQ